MNPFKHKPKSQLELMRKIRKPMSPPTRIVPPKTGKDAPYDRKEEKKVNFEE